MIRILGAQNILRVKLFTVTATTVLIEIQQRHSGFMKVGGLCRRNNEWSPAVTRSLGRTKNRWEDDVKSDIVKLGITNLRDCIRNRPRWKKFVEKAKTTLKLQRLQKKKGGLCCGHNLNRCHNSRSCFKD